MAMENLLSEVSMGTSLNSIGGCQGATLQEGHGFFKDARWLCGFFFVENDRLLIE